LAYCIDDNFEIPSNMGALVGFVFKYLPFLPKNPRYLKNLVSNRDNISDVLNGRSSSSSSSNWLPLRILLADSIFNQLQFE